MSKSYPITIDDSVWIEINMLILKGVISGKNSIIAVHSVVTKKVSQNLLFVGNPMKTIKAITV